MKIEVNKVKEISLRPHHIRAIYDMLYPDQKFNKNELNELRVAYGDWYFEKLIPFIKKLKKLSPNTPVRLVPSIDSICSTCPSLNNPDCQKKEAITGLAKKFGLRFNKTYQLGEFLSALKYYNNEKKEYQEWISDVSVRPGKTVTEIYKIPYIPKILSIYPCPNEIRIRSEEYFEGPKLKSIILNIRVPESKNTANYTIREEQGKITLSPSSEIPEHVKSTILNSELPNKIKRLTL